MAKYSTTPKSFRGLSIRDKPLKRLGLGQASLAPPLKQGGNGRFGSTLPMYRTCCTTVSLCSERQNFQHSTHCETRSLPNHSTLVSTPDVSPILIDPLDCSGCFCSHRDVRCRG